MLEMLAREERQMMCNLCQYLSGEELTCRRIAKSCNDGTQAQAEWAKTAQVLFERRREHILICKECCKSQ